MQINMVTLRILATKVSLRLASRQELEYATMQKGE